MRIIDLFARRMPGAVLMRAAVSWVGVVVRVSSLAFVAVAVIGAAVLRFTSLAGCVMIGQLADFVTFAGPEEHEGSGRRDRDRVAEK